MITSKKKETGYEVLDVGALNYHRHLRVNTGGVPPRMLDFDYDESESNEKKSIKKNECREKIQIESLNVLLFSRTELKMASENTLQYTILLYNIYNDRQKIDNGDI